MSESKFWSNDIHRLNKFGKAQRIEDSLNTGVSDVFYVIEGKTGFIELKYRAYFPKRDNTPIKFTHFSMAQLMFIVEVSENGGLAWLLCQIGSEAFLFDAPGACLVHQGLINQMNICEYSVWHDDTPTNIKELKEVLTCNH